MLLANPLLQIVVIAIFLGYASEQSSFAEGLRSAPCSPTLWRRESYAPLGFVGSAIIGMEGPTHGRRSEVIQ